MQFRVGAGAGRRPHPGPAPPAAAAGLDPAGPTRKPDHSWEITIGGLFKTTWLINGELQPGLRRHLPEARLDRHLGDPQPHQRRPPDAPPPHRLVPARPRRQAAAALGRLPQGHLLRLSGERILRRRPPLRLHRQFVIHCHMLDHEDHGLMSQFEVVRSRSSSHRRQGHDGAVGDELIHRFRGPARPRPCRHRGLPRPQARAALRRRADRGGRRRPGGARGAGRRPGARPGR